jgi:hypothetical protein
MSTNYYGYYKGEDPAKDEGIHLCQSAAGWEFLLQADPSEGITDIRSWLRQLDTFERICNEYGREISIDDLLEAIESRLELMNEGKLLNRLDHNGRSGFHDYSVRSKQFRSGGAAFASYSFS